MSTKPFKANSDISPSHWSCCCNLLLSYFKLFNTSPWTACLAHLKTLLCHGNFSFSWLCLALGGTIPSRLTWVGGCVVSPLKQRWDKDDKVFLQPVPLMLPWSLVLSYLVLLKANYSLLLFNPLHSDRQFKAEQRNQAISNIIPVQQQTFRTKAAISCIITIILSIFLLITHLSGDAANNYLLRSDLVPFIMSLKIVHERESSISFKTRLGLEIGTNGFQTKPCSSVKLGNILAGNWKGDKLRNNVEHSLVIHWGKKRGKFLAPHIHSPVGKK